MLAGTAILLCLAVPGALAAPITYTFSGSVSGTLGATPCTNAQITIVATGDTSTADCGFLLFCNTLSGPNTFQSVVTGGGGGAAVTTTAVVSSLNPSVVGQSVTFTATVTGSSPTGTVQFKEGALNLGAPVTVSGGSAALAITGLTQGAHSIMAVYSGDANNATSTSPVVVQTVNALIVPTPPATQPIPTISEFGLILLAVLLGALAILRLRFRAGKAD